MSAITLLCEFDGIIEGKLQLPLPKKKKKKKIEDKECKHLRVSLSRLPVKPIDTYSQ